MSEKPTKVKDHEGVEIFLTEEGKFSATIEWKTIAKTTLRAVEKEIDDRKQAVRAFFVDSSDYQVEEEFLLRFESDGKLRTKSGLRASWKSRPYIWEAEVVANLRDLHKRSQKSRRDFQAEFQKILKRAKEATRETLGQKPERY